MSKTRYAKCLEELDQKYRHICILEKGHTVLHKCHCGVEWGIPKP